MGKKLKGENDDFDDVSNPKIKMPQLLYVRDKFDKNYL